MIYLRQYRCMNQHQAVISTIEHLGGIATLSEIYRNIFNISDCEWHTKTPFASIRRIVQTNKSIYKIKPGLYALVGRRKEFEEKGIISEMQTRDNSEMTNNFNHSYYQGLLIEIGNLYQLGTFVPNQDKNKLFLRKKLGEITTIKKIPDFSYQNLVKKSSTIDVIWFNSRKMPASFFEIEHTTDIQNSLLKYEELQDFSAKMIIVADERRRNEFNYKMEYSAFRDLTQNKRVDFLSYDKVGKIYESELTKSNIGLDV